MIETPAYAGSLQRAGLASAVLLLLCAALTAVLAVFDRSLPVPGTDTGWIHAVAVLPAWLLGVHLLMPRSRIHAVLGPLGFVAGSVLAMASSSQAGASGLVAATAIAFMIGGAGISLASLPVRPATDTVLRALGAALIVLGALAVAPDAGDQLREHALNLHPVAAFAVILCGLLWWIMPVRHDIDQRTAQLCASAMMGIALLVLCGWSMANANIVQGATRYVPMQFNTALCVLLAATSLRLLAAGRRNLALWPLAPIAVVAIATLLEEFAGMPLGVGQWLVWHGIVAEGVAPGRMAPNTASALLIGILAIAAAPRDSRSGLMRWSATWACGFTITVIAGIALSGYLFDSPVIRSWGQHTPMASLTSVALTFYGLGLGFTGGQQQRSKHHYTLWMPLLVAIASVIASTSAWVAITAEHRNQERHMAELRLADLVRTIDLGTTLRTAALRRMGARIGDVPEDARVEAFQSQSDLFLEDFPAILGMGLIGTDGSLRSMRSRPEPVDGCTRDALVEGVRRLAVASHALAGIASVPHCADTAHLIKLPIAGTRGNAGALVVLSDLNVLVSRLFGPLPDELGLKIAIAGDELYRQGKVDGEPTASTFHLSSGVPMRISLWWNASQRPARLANALLLIGLLSGGLLALALRLASLARERALLSELSAQQLRDQIVESERLHEALQDVERERADIVENISDAFYALDTEWRFVQVNPRAERMLRHDRAQLLGRSVWEMFPEAVHEPVYAQFHAAMARMEPLFTELWYEPLGSWFEVRANPHPKGLAVFFQEVTERKRAELALRKAQAASERAQRMAQVGSWEVDLVTGQRAWSDQAMRIFGVTAEQVALGIEEIARHVHPDDRALMLEGTRTLHGGQDELDIEYRVLHADGTIVFVHELGTVFLDSTGKPILAAGSMQDVSDRRRVEDQLRDLTKQLELSLTLNRLVMQHSLDVICVLDASGNFALISDGCERLWGYAPRELQGRPFLDLVVAEDHARSQAAAAAIRSGQPTLDFRNRFLTRDGRVLHLQWSAVWSDREQLMFCVARDISESRQVAAALRRSEALLLNAQRIAHVGNWENDLVTGRIDRSEEAHRIYGTSADSLPADIDGYLLSVHPDDRAKVLEAQRQIVEEAVALDIEHRIVRADGEVRWVHERGEVECDSSGVAVQVSGTVLDITDRKLAELGLERINRLYSVLSHINEMIVRVRDVHELFRTATAIAVTHGRFQMARVLQIGDDGCARPVSSAGMEDEFLASLAIPIDEGPLSLGTIGTALRTGKPDYCNDIAADPRMQPWQEAARQRGLRSTAAFPLHLDGRVVAAITFFSSEDNYFLVDELEVLSAVATDLSFALASIDVERQRVQAESRNRRLTRLYSVSSRINATIVRVADATRLYAEACRIAVEHGGFLMAWVGLLDPRDEGLVPVARFGRDEGYLDAVRISASQQSIEGRGPGGEALRTGKAAVCNDIAEAHASFAWRDQAVARGFLSCAAFPLRRQGIVVGVFVVYADSVDYFDEEELQLLDALAENLSFALDAQLRDQQRQRAEQALRDSEASLANAQRIAHLGSWAWHTRDDRVEWSDEVYRLAGVTRATFAGTSKDFLALVHPDDRDDVRRVFDEAADSGRDFEHEYRLVRPDGSEAVMLELGQVFHDDAGQVARMAGTVLDITQRKRAEMHVAEQRAILGGIAARRPLSESLHGIVRLYEERHPHALCSILLLDETGQRLVHGAAPSLPQAYNEAIDGILIGPSVGSCGRAAFLGTSVTVTDIANDPLWADYAELALGHGLKACWSKPIISSTGKVLATFGVYYREVRAASPEEGVTIDSKLAIAAVAIEQAAAYRRLQLSEQRFRSLFDEHPDAVYAMDRDGRYTDCNDGFRQSTGATEGEVIGQPLESRVIPEQQAFVREQFEAAARGEARTYEAISIDAHGNHRDTRITNLPIIVEGQVTGVFGIAHDISALRERERELAAALDLAQHKSDQLRETLAALNQRNRELQDFAFVASHDLQEPLRKIRAFSDRLLQGHAQQLDARARDYLARTEQAATRMQTLIDDLLAYSRVASRGGQAVEVDLGKTIAIVVDDLEARLDSSGGRVDIGAMPQIIADPTQMRQLFQNLIANALKFHQLGRPPLVQISAHRAREPRGAWRFEVRDNGIGFDQKHAERIFAPFQRLHGREQYAGTGIGLAIVRRIVERHGGSIEAVGNPGEGAVFIITLPERPRPDAKTGDDARSMLDSH